MIKNYLLSPESDASVYLFISDKERDGVSIETTIDFLNKIFSGEKNLKIVLTFINTITVHSKM